MTGLTRRGLPTTALGYVAEPGLVVVDAAAADDRTAFAFLQALAAL